MMLKPDLLTRESFAPFGQVVELQGVQPLAINQGFAQRFGDLVAVDVGDGAAQVNIFVAEPRPVPIAIRMMERHPLGSQMFYPLQDRPWLVLVCSDPQDASSFRAFAATGTQGVNYRRNVWHHPLLALDAGSRFIVVDRKGEGVNMDENWLDSPLFLDSV